MIPDEEKHRHDFKNQLSIVLGFADVLLTEMSPDDARRPDLENDSEGGDRGHGAPRAGVSGARHQ